MNTVSIIEAPRNWWRQLLRIRGRLWIVCSTCRTFEPVASRPPRHFDQRCRRMEDA